MVESCYAGFIKAVEQQTHVAIFYSNDNKITKPICRKLWEVIPTAKAKLELLCYKGENTFEFILFRFCFISYTIPSLLEKIWIKVKKPYLSNLWHKWLRINIIAENVTQTWQLEFNATQPCKASGSLTVTFENSRIQSRIIYISRLLDS